MECDQMALVKKIQEIQFVAIELALYLDTHPCDKEALDDYNCAVEVLERYLNEYMNQFGSLLWLGHHGVEGKWDWADQPWPWQM
ncbi:MAG: spore coat protein CotJB [Sporomusaceae bacterium]|nr:spore coat protein CotJB [Sporomusaceae bacterium]